MRITTLKKAIRIELEKVVSKENAKRIIDESVWKGDPYDWSPGAMFTISLESGLPSSFYHEYGFQFWKNVEKNLDREIYFENVNSAILAVYS
jgi:hypothetical protein